MKSIGNFLKKNALIIGLVMLGVVLYYTSWASLKTDLNNLITPATVASIQVE